jgi:hypothetical protein
MEVANLETWCHSLEGFCQAKKIFCSKKSQIFCIIKRNNFIVWQAFISLTAPAFSLIFSVTDYKNPHQSPIRIKARAEQIQHAFRNYFSFTRLYDEFLCPWQVSAPENLWYHAVSKCLSQTYGSPANPLWLAA